MGNRLFWQGQKQGGQKRPVDGSLHQSASTENWLVDGLDLRQREEPRASSGVPGGLVGKLLQFTKYSSFLHCKILPVVE